jgi:hypothetical protein
VIVQLFMYFQLRILFLNTIVPLYNEQVDVLLEMTTSLSSLYLLIQYLNKIRQRELNPGIKDFDEKIQIIANLTFSLVIALFEPEDLNAQQRSLPPCAVPCSCAVGNRCRRRLSILVTLATLIRQMAFEKVAVALFCLRLNWLCSLRLSPPPLAECAVSALPVTEGPKRKQILKIRIRSLRSKTFGVFLDG